MIGVHDSRLGSCSREPVDGGVRVVGAPLSVIAAFDGARCTARIDDRDIEVVRRRWLMLPRTWVASATLDGVGIRVVPRGLRLAELVCGRQTVAVLARPRRGERIIRWADSDLDDVQIALAHALAVYAGF